MYVYKIVYFVPGTKQRLMRDHITASCAKKAEKNFKSIYTNCEVFKVTLIGVA